MNTGWGTGFVLRTWPLRESDLIVSLFTLERGKLRGVAHRATRPKSRWGGALEPMTELTCQWRAREGQELHALSEPSIVASPYHPQPGLAVNWTLAFLAELIDTTTAPEDADETLYRLVRSCIDALLAGTEVFAVARYAETWVLRLAGVLPDLQGCAGCGAPLNEEGGTWHWRLHGLGCSACVDSERGDGAHVLPQDLEWLRATRRTGPAALQIPDRLVLRRIGVFLRGVLREHLGGRELKSERFLGELESVEELSTVQPALERELRTELEPELEAKLRPGLEPQLRPGRRA